MQSNRTHYTAGAALLPAILHLAIGCQAPRAPAKISWDRATEVEIQPAWSWRGQLSSSTIMAPEVINSLCPEFDLLHVRTAEQWKKLRPSLAFPPDSRMDRLDFGRGSVIGLVARLGRPAEEKFPIDFDAVRVSEGAGWIRFRFSSGYYYPVYTGPWVILAYAPGLLEPRVVEINNRMFALNE